MGDARKRRIGQMADEDLKLYFPFMFTRTGRLGDTIDKFTLTMSQDCLRAFAVFGPLRCLHSAFPGSVQERKYRGMFQQMFACFARLAGLRSQFSSDPVAAGVIPDDGDRASMDSAAMYQVDAEYAIEQGSTDYTLQVISKKHLEQFKNRNRDIDWDNPNKEQLAITVFKRIAPIYVRIDAIIDLKTDAVTQWEKKTRPQLLSYGNQAALTNMRKGFPPRPIYLVAIDTRDWKRCVLDPMGTITIGEDGAITDFNDKLAKQQQLRATWLQKKDPQTASYFYNVDDWTLEKLKKELDEVNSTIRFTKNTSGVRQGEYVVSNVWDFETSENNSWNGRGLVGSVKPGTLSLCQALLRLTCGDRVKDAGWTPQMLRSFFGRQYEADTHKCLEFERGGQIQRPPRPLTCTYSTDAICAGFKTMATSNPSLEYAQCVEDATRSLEAIKFDLTTSEDIWQVGLAFGKPELTEYTGLRGNTEFQNSHIVVHDRCSEQDALTQFDAVVISLEEPQVPKFNVLENSKVLVCDAIDFQPRFWELLFSEHTRDGSLVVIGKSLGSTALSRLRYLKAIVVPVCEDQSLQALSSYLSVAVVTHSKLDLDNAIGNAEKIFTCRDKLIVYHRDWTARCGTVELGRVVELQVSGASHRQFMERIEYVRMAAAAMNSARVKGIIPGDGLGLYRVGECLTDKYPHVGGALKVAKSHFQDFVVAYMVGLHNDKDMLREGFIDLYEAAEETLDELLGVCYNSASVGANKRSAGGATAGESSKRISKRIKEDRSFL